MKYLERHSHCTEYTAHVIKEFLIELKEWKLTKAEKLQLLNARPSSLVELYLVNRSIAIDGIRSLKNLKNDFLGIN
jgi:hypothetical protein